MNRSFSHSQAASLGRPFGRTLDGKDTATERTRDCRKGFSLIQVMTFLMTIGMLAAIMVPRFGSWNISTTTFTQRQHAENIVSVFTAGRDAGSIHWVTSSRNACVADVVEGKVAPASSIFAGKVFKLSNSEGFDLSGVYRFIGIDAKKNLFFDRTGGQKPN